MAIGSVRCFILVLILPVVSSIDPNWRTVMDIFKKEYMSDPAALLKHLAPVNDVTADEGLHNWCELVHKLLYGSNVAQRQENDRNHYAAIIGAFLFYYRERKDTAFELQIEFSEPRRIPIPTAFKTEGLPKPLPTYFQPLKGGEGYFQFAVDADTQSSKKGFKAALKPFWQNDYYLEEWLTQSIQIDTKPTKLVFESSENALRLVLLPDKSRRNDFKEKKKTGKTTFYAAIASLYTKEELQQYIGKDDQLYKQSFILWYDRFVLCKDDLEPINHSTAKEMGKRLALLAVHKTTCQNPVPSHLQSDKAEPLTIVIMALNLFRQGTSENNIVADVEGTSENRIAADVKDLCLGCATAAANKLPPPPPPKPRTKRQAPPQSFRPLQGTKPPPKRPTKRRAPTSTPSANKPPTKRRAPPPQSFRPPQGTMPLSATLHALAAKLQEKTTQQTESSSTIPVPVAIVNSGANSAIPFMIPPPPQQTAPTSTPSANTVPVNYGANPCNFRSILPKPATSTPTPNDIGQRWKCSVERIRRRKKKPASTSTPSANTTSTPSANTATSTPSANTATSTPSANMKMILPPARPVGFMTPPPPQQTGAVPVARVNSGANSANRHILQ